MTSATASLRPGKVTPDNVLAACRRAVAPEQERFVPPVARSLAEAYVQPGTAWPRPVFDGDRPVGFVMAFFDVRFDLASPDDRPRSDSGGRPSPPVSRAGGTGDSRWTACARRSSGAAGGARR